MGLSAVGAFQALMDEDLISCLQDGDIHRGAVITWRLYTFNNVRT